MSLFDAMIGALRQMGCESEEGEVLKRQPPNAKTGARLGLDSTESTDGELRRTESWGAKDRNTGTEIAGGNRLCQAKDFEFPI